MVPFSHPSPRPKQHLDPLLRFCTAHAAISVCFTVSWKVFPEIALFLGYPDPYIVLGSFGPLESHTRNGILIGSAHVDFQQTHISIFALCPGNQVHIVGCPFVPTQGAASNYRVCQKIPVCFEVL